MSLGLLLIPSWLARWADGTLPPRFAVTEETRGRLALPSGAILAWGLVTGSLRIALPYTRRATPGSYDLVCGMLRGRVAYAAIRFSSAAIATWEPAQWNFDGVADVANRKQWVRVVDGVPYYDIGNGNTCFVDATHARDHTAWCSHHQGTISLRLLQSGKRDAAFLSAFKDALAREAPDPMDTVVDRQDAISLPRGGNAIAVRPGNRSRGFSAWFGLDAHGVPAAFVTDFHMIHIAPPIARATAVLAAWEAKQLIALNRYARRDPLIAALAEQLDAERDGNAELATWLFDRAEVGDVNGTDDVLCVARDVVDKELIAAALGPSAL